MGIMSFDCSFVQVYPFFDGFAFVYYWAILMQFAK